MANSYRFRLVSMSCDPNYVFSIDNHDLTIIETDGINTKPHVVDSIQIFAAQRYSFVVRFCLSLESCVPLLSLRFIMAVTDAPPYLPRLRSSTQTRM